MKIFLGFGVLRVLAVASCLMASSASAATISITSIQTPQGIVNSGGNPIFVADFSSPSQLSWSGVGFEVINNQGTANLAIFGNFTCPTTSTGCDDYFAVFFNFSITETGLNQQLGLSGSYYAGSQGSVVLLMTSILSGETFPGANMISLNGTASNSLQTFNIASALIPSLATGNFVGQTAVGITLSPGANVSLPRGSTADLFLIPSASNAIPEPTTLGIVMGAGALLVYLKRMNG